MTLKHINFYDSPVMRELARQAIKNGKVSQPSVDEIVKNVGLKPTIKSTGNLFIDLVSLAEGLRNKGFASEAESLEEKIVAYKRASKEYSEELSIAHPEGDTTMGEATNGLGDVETLESAHNKIISVVVDKNPTGKQSAVVTNILKATRDILEIKKKAQDTKDPGLENSAEDNGDDVFSGKSITVQKNINEINEILASEFPKISSILNSQSLDPSKWIFDYSRLVSGSDSMKNLYATRAEVDLASINKLLQDNKNLYGENFTGDQLGKIYFVLTSYAKNKEFDKLVYYGNIVGNIGSKYFSGSQPNSDKREYLANNEESANNQIFHDNPNSIWVWSGWVPSLNGIHFKFDQDRLLQAAKEIQTIQYNNFKTLFSDEKLNQATTKIQAEIKSDLTSWNEVIEYFNNTLQLTPVAKSNTSLVMTIISQIGKLKKYLEDGDLNKKLVDLTNAMWDSKQVLNISTKCNEAIVEIKNLIQLLNTKPLSPGDVIVQDSSQVVSLLMTTAKMYWEAAKKVDQKSSTYKEYSQNQRVTFNLAKTVKAGTGKPYSILYQSVKEVFPQATTYEKLIQESQKWLEESSNNTGITADQFEGSKVAEKLIPEMKKFAEGLIRKTPSSSSSAVKPVTGPGVKSTPSSSGSAIGLAKANMNDPKEVAVATMQQYLAYFAEALSSEAAKAKFTDYDAQDIASIVRTGPKANPAVNTYDGKWGTQTQAALDLANKYLKQLGVSGLDTKARYSNRVTSSDAESVAKNNASLLSQGTQTLTSNNKINTNGQQNYLYDKLPQHIDWNNVEYPLLQHYVPVTSNDLSSLGSLYDLITKNDWVKLQYTKDEQGFDVEGLPGKAWIFIVQWFQKRAQFVYNTSVRADKNIAALARQYFNAAKRLEGQLGSFFASHGYDSRNEDKVIDSDAIREYSDNASKNVDSGKGNKIGPGGKSSESNGGSTQYISYHQQGAEGDGKDLKSPTRGDDGPPISTEDGTINLASRWFNGLDQKLGISHNPLLNPELFRRYPAADLAKTFYAGSGDNLDEQARSQALIASGVEVESYDEAAQDYIVYFYNPVTRKKQRTYAMRVPAYQKAYKSTLMGGPMRAFGNLLQMISSALAPAISNWMRSTQPNNAEKQVEEAWHTEWQRILGQQANEASGV
jgi:hypothetical protein